MDYAVKVCQGAAEHIILFIADGDGLRFVTADRLPTRGEKTYVNYPHLRTLSAGTGYFDHLTGVGGRFSNDTVVREFCDKGGSIAYAYQSGRIRKVLISD